MCFNNTRHIGDARYPKNNTDSRSTDQVLPRGEVRRRRRRRRRRRGTVVRRVGATRTNSPPESDRGEFRVVLASGRLQSHPIRDGRSFSRVGPRNASGLTRLASCSTPGLASYEIRTLLVAVRAVTWRIVPLTPLGARHDEFMMLNHTRRRDCAH